MHSVYSLGNQNLLYYVLMNDCCLIALSLLLMVPQMMMMVVAALPLNGVMFPIHENDLKMEQHLRMYVDPSPAYEIDDRREDL